MNEYGVHVIRYAEVLQKMSAWEVKELSQHSHSLTNTANVD
jgi:hypothetical protein